MWLCHPHIQDVAKHSEDEHAYGQEIVPHRSQKWNQNNRIEEINNFLIKILQL